MPESTALVLAPPNMTVPASGPTGLLGDRVLQAPILTTIRARHRRVLLWPDDSVTRALFTAPEIEFLSQQTDEPISDVYCLYSPTDAIPAGRETDCQLLRVADVMAQQRNGVAVHQPARLDPRGNVPVWQQLWDGLGLPGAVPPLPWVMPAPAASPARAVILSPFSGAPKNAIAEQWWPEFVRLLPDVPVIVPVFGQAEFEKATRLFASTSAHVIDADLRQTIALASPPNAVVLGIDGGRLTLLAGVRKSPVYAFFGIWPASAWALPNVQPLSSDLKPAHVIQKVCAWP